MIPSVEVSYAAEHEAPYPDHQTAVLQHERTEFGPGWVLWYMQSGEPEYYNIGLDIDSVDTAVKCAEQHLYQQFKVRENRLRRMADRQGLRLQKSRRRDPRAVDYDTYHLLDASSGAVIHKGLDSGFGLSLDDVELELTG